MSALAQLLSLREATAAEAAAHDLKRFVRDAWPVIEPAPFTEGWHIDCIADHLRAVSAGEIRHLLINIPPRHSKSLQVAVFWPVWEWIRKPETRWLFASYAQALSTRDSRKCRLLIQSKWFQQRYGHSFKLVGDQNTKTFFENDKRGYRIATAVEAGTTGEGGDRIVVDDPINAIDAHSETERAKCKTWWDESMSTRGNDPKTSTWVVVMQRLHQDDLSGHILETDSGVEHLCLPAEAPSPKQTSIGVRDPRTAKGQLLWPKRFDKEAVAQLRQQLGPHAAAGQLDQDPAPAEGTIVKLSMIRYWVTSEYARLLGAETCVAPLAFDDRLQSWDCTFKEAGTSYTVGQMWGRTTAGCWLLDQYRDKPDFTAAHRAVSAMAEKWPGYYLKLIEDAANGAAVYSTLKQSVSGLRLSFPKDVNRNKKTIQTGRKLTKEQRLFLVLPFFETGCVFVPHPKMPGYEWSAQWVDEVTKFPKSRNDDQVDAMTQALLEWCKPRKVFV